MESKDLKQPYKRLTEFLSKQTALPECLIEFYSLIVNGYNPRITEEIKSYLPDDFDFSEDSYKGGLTLNTIALTRFGKKFMDLESYEKSAVSQEYDYNIKLHPEKISTNDSKPNVHEDLIKAVNISKEIKDLSNIRQMNNEFYDKENQRKMEDEDLQKKIYTQLAKEGKFEQLPDTCEFSEPVELEVWDIDDIVTKDILGKFKGRYISYLYYNYQNAKLPKPRIDFSVFKTGDIVEVETNTFMIFIGYFSQLGNGVIFIKSSNTGSPYTCNIENINKITKIR